MLRRMRRIRYWLGWPWVRHFDTADEVVAWLEGRSLGDDS